MEKPKQRDKKDINRFYKIATIVSLILAVAALCISLWRCEPFEFNSLAVFGSLLSLMVTILLGVVGFNYFIQKKDSEGFKDYAYKLIEEEREERNKQFVTLQEKVNSFGLEIIDNPEFIYAITDSSNHFLFGIKRDDGSIEWGAGIPKPVKDELDALKKRLAELEKK